MNKNYEPPQFLKLSELLLPLKLKFSWEAESYTIDERLRKVTKEIDQNQKESKIAIFNRFTSALLEGFRTKGRDYGQRIELMNKYIHDFRDVTDDIIQKVLMENHYPLKKRGLEVVLSARRIVEPASFEWHKYFYEAESGYESGYGNDKFLKIRGVGRKVRDFALSEFSTCFCAIDRHVADVIRRTGLLLYGYGQPDFGTSPTENYDFLQKLIIQLSKESGWSPDSFGAYSPKEIDAMFWSFGNDEAICKAQPECFHCPVKDICLTFQNWKGAPIKSKEELKKERKEEKRRINEQMRAYMEEHPERVEEIKKKYGL